MWQSIVEHWKTYLPSLYQSHVKAGTLDQAIERAMEQTMDEEAPLIAGGMSDQEAWQAVRENHLYMRPEADQED